MSELSRRSLITGLISLVAAPAIVRVSSLMPVKVIAPVVTAGPTYFQDRVWWVQDDASQTVQFSVPVSFRAWAIQIYKSSPELKKILERARMESPSELFGAQIFGGQT